jgi:hypothetical protein
MAEVFPTMSSGSMRVVGSLLSEAVAMYPVKTSQSYIVRKISFLDDSEQRWVVRKKLFSCTLEYKNLNGYDLSLLRDFFTSQKGMYVSESLTSTFSITLSGMTYSYCVFDQDYFESDVAEGELYSTTLQIKQVRQN